uniref:Uncharacterized protein n=1 Tax=Populus trichocarpa TaxID=3694 RepID=A0A2K2C637_POPTR
MTEFIMMEARFLQIQNAKSNAASTIFLNCRQTDTILSHSSLNSICQRFELVPLHHQAKTCSLLSQSQTLHVISIETPAYQNHHHCPW